MGKKNKNQQTSKKELQKTAKEFGLLNSKKFKKMKKKEGEYFDSKKELMKTYTSYLLDLFPDVIEFIIKYGHIQDPEIQEIKKNCYCKFTNEQFIKIIRKEIKNENFDMDNIKLYPIIIKDILVEGKKVNDSLIAENPNAQLIDLTNLYELSLMILKKRLKKFEKAGISQGLAFDLLSVIPVKSAINTSQFYRVRTVYDVFYEYAKNGEVPFIKAMELLVDEDKIPMFITFALLERKEKFTKLTDSQKALYCTITNWCLDTMEKEMKKDEIESIIRVYITNRKNDEAKGRDSNRRYQLSMLPSEYSNILKVVNHMIANDGNNKKYL